MRHRPQILIHYAKHKQTNLSMSRVSHTGKEYPKANNQSPDYWEDMAIKEKTLPAPFPLPKTTSAQHYLPYWKLLSVVQPTVVKCHNTSY